MRFSSFLTLLESCRCTYCPIVKKEFDKATESLRGTNQPFVLATVDCYESGKETCLKYSIEIEDDPIIKVFRLGEMSQQYNQEENAGKLTTVLNLSLALIDHYN